MNEGGADERRLSSGIGVQHQESEGQQRHRHRQEPSRREGEGGSAQAPPSEMSSVHRHPRETEEVKRSGETQKGETAPRARRHGCREPDRRELQEAHTGEPTPERPPFELGRPCPEISIREVQGTPPAVRPGVGREEGPGQLRGIDPTPDPHGGEPKAGSSETHEAEGSQRPPEIRGRCGPLLDEPDQQPRLQDPTEHQGADHRPRGNCSQQVQARHAPSDTPESRLDRQGGRQRERRRSEAHRFRILPPRSPGQYGAASRQFRPRAVDPIQALVERLLPVLEGHAVSTLRSLAEMAGPPADCPAAPRLGPQSRPPPPGGG